MLTTTDFDEYTSFFRQALEGVGCDEGLTQEFSSLGGGLVLRGRNSCDESDAVEASAVFLTSFSVACTTAKMLQNYAGGEHPDAVVRFLAAYPHAQEMQVEFRELLRSVRCFCST